MRDQTLNVIVTGRVQGVGYRYFCYRSAAEMNITGWVKNLNNGNVEIMAQGDKSVLDEFLIKLKIGPGYAEVENLEIVEVIDSVNYTSFSIER